METRVERFWDIQGRARGPVFETGGFLLQREYRVGSDALFFRVLGRRAGRAGVLIRHKSDKGHQVTAEVFAHVEPPDDIGETKTLCDEIHRCANLIKRIPFVGKYAQGAAINSFIDFTPISGEEEAEVRRLVSEALQVPTSHIVGFEK